MQFGVLGNRGLQEDRAFLRIEPRGQPVNRHFHRILRHGGGVGVVRRQRVPVRNEEKTLVLLLRIVLKLDPVLKRAEIMPDVEPSGGTHPTEDSLALSHVA